MPARERFKKQCSHTRRKRNKLRLIRFFPLPRRNEVVIRETLPESRWTLRFFGSSGIIVDRDAGGRGDGDRIQGTGCAQAFAPLREGGAARGKYCQWDWACGANGKGGGGSTAGSRRCMRPLGPSAEVLIRSSPVRSRACRNGQAQYSPRRGPCHFPSSMHGHPIHGRATPLSEGGGFWLLP